MRASEFLRASVFGNKTLHEMHILVCRNTGKSARNFGHNYSMCMYMPEINCDCRAEMKTEYGTDYFCNKWLKEGVRKE